MFSASKSFTEPPPSSLRNPRRRQRTTSGENGLVLPEPKRRRSVLTPDTFRSSEEPSVTNDDTPKSNGFAFKAEVPKSSSQRTLRDSKRGTDRAARGEIGLVLTENEQYAVKQLPATPDLLHKDYEGDYTGELYSDIEGGLCLALTSTGAAIWPYCSSASQPETFSFDITSYSKISSDNLPLGSLVYSSSSTSDAGLVLIAPAAGKILYWESITAAASLDWGQQRRQCIEGSVGGYLSGDLIVQLVKAEPAGFVLRFRSGRLAQLSVRDDQGRPAVSVQFMKSNIASHAPSGLFGSIRSAFNNGKWRRDVVAIKAGRISKQLDRQIIVATEEGVFQSWEIHRNGHHMLRNETPTAEAILKTISAGDPIEDNPRSPDFQLLDFAILPQSAEQNDNDVQSTDVLALIALTDKNATSYQLVDMVIREEGEEGEEVKIFAIHPIRCYKLAAKHHKTQQPKLLLPSPGHVAYVVFDRAIVLASIHRPENTAEDQLLREAKVPLSFQDVVDFRPETKARIVGYGSENATEIFETSGSKKGRLKNPSCVFLVRGYGVIRVTCFEATFNYILHDQLAVKSKIEQAIIYSSSDTLLNFAGRAEVQYSLGDVEAAALEVSHEILNSSSRVIPPAVPQMSTHLSMKAAALHSLAVYLKNTYQPLSRSKKWTLLWDAEKVAGARRLWKFYDDATKVRDTETKSKQRSASSDLQKTGLAWILDFLPHQVFTPMAIDKGENDPVRHWFTKDLDRIQLVAAMAAQTLIGVSSEIDDEFELLKYVGELNDVCTGVLAPAFKFREDNKQIYGLGSEAMENGVFDQFEDYRGLPLPWTSFHGPDSVEEDRRHMSISDALHESIRSSLSAVKQLSKVPEKDSFVRTLIEKLRKDALLLSDLFLAVGAETFKWIQAQPQDKLSKGDFKFAEEFRGHREHLLMELVERGMTQESKELAEKYVVLNVLAKIQYDRLVKLEADASDSRGRDQLKLHKEELVNDFEKPGYGANWAVNWFSTLIGQGKSAYIFENFSGQGRYVTQFFRSDSHYTKLGWINDILNLSDYSNASTTLLDYQAKNEGKLWNQKIELGMAKLSLLADAEAKGEEPHTRKTSVDAVARGFVNIKAQSQIRELLLPLVDDAIDQAFAAQVLVTNLTKYTTAQKPMLKTGLEQSFVQLLEDQPLTDLQLVDILTLIHSPPTDTNYLENNSNGDLFLKALEIIASGKNDELVDRQTLEKLVWRRCMLRSDWVKLNQTEHKYDTDVDKNFGETALFRLLVAGFSTDFWSPEKSNTEPWRPIDVLDAGTTAEKLGSALSIEKREHLANDLLKESKALSKYVENGRLDVWFDGIVDEARTSAKELESAAAQAEGLMKQIGDTLKLDPTVEDDDDEEGERGQKHVAMESMESD